MSKKFNLDLNLRKEGDTGLFVREPVNDICREIEESSSSKIILGGGRGSGKSIILHHLENKNIDGRQPFIYTWFDPAGWGELIKPYDLKQKIYQIRYEALVCHKLLQYVEMYYGISYAKYFTSVQVELDQLLEQFDDYLNNFAYIEISEDYMKTLTSKSLMPEIMYLIQKNLPIDSLNLAIDRFDWIDNRSSLAQKYLSECFTFFDKVVITTDDKEIVPIENRGDLFKKEYTYIESTYGKHIDIVKEIISRRIAKYNQDMRKQGGCEEFPVSMITEEIYRNLVERANGNISVIVKAIYETITDFEWDPKTDLEESLGRNCHKQLQKVKELENMGSLPKLHL